MDIDIDTKEKTKAIGIDLGTTYSCVGVWKHDKIEIIPNDEGNRTTPSMVAFTSNERLVGDAANFQISTNPKNTVFDVKRLIGRRYSDPSVQSDKKLWPFTIVAGKNGKPMVEVAYKGEKRVFAAEEISSMVLAKMKKIAEQYLQCDAAVLNKENINLVLVDVTPLSLGISVNNGVMDVVVPRNTPIPVLKETYVTTLYDNQTGVIFPIYEGERSLVEHNNLLGEFFLSGIPPARCAVPQIRVCFEVDEEGILTASAQDVGTGANNQITVTNERERLNKVEIDRMVADEEIFGKEDEEMAKKHWAKNTLECYTCNMKSRVTVAKSNGTITTRFADAITGALNTAEEWLDENDDAKIEEILAQLNKLSLKCWCLT
ncbi:hypothetical protein SUGI_0988150 [Cryptomeria japonica]|nr:hypothetical protein SUGI_0988150 [Cryptomeria japonica]